MKYVELETAVTVAKRLMAESFAAGVFVGAGLTVLLVWL